MSEKVELFTTPTCPACKQVKSYLEEQGVDYVEHDISQDDEARKRMAEETGQMVVPIAKIGDDYIVGFDKEEYDRLLQL
ncbi:glutaredoxin family protein [Natranaerobius thermophilus]|uniref:Glutaredoxin n=1 Tax=Natranaerobius thermophilus (strain ATCC BAA-1301 / DSM 18059 / JW/NM-WN-LF) TaxID=457570 RepID=B2A8M1_NATTJ|nr:glutaredoxin family protein [Natranaerobius thermophilus]ACB85905.1 glutaredoxin [Natranaerobius thermophilus JW/NM-WN-LF]